MKDKINVCFGASSGGHLNQLIQLLDAMDKDSFDICYLVTTHQTVKDRLSDYGKVHVLGECNRFHPIHAIKVIIRSFRILIHTSPNVVITTGSLPIAIFCLTAKLFNSKTVWIDSIANLERLSMSGRLMYHFTDLFVVQWEHLPKKYPKAVYRGELI